MKRRSLTTLQRLKVFEAYNGKCHICGYFCGGKWEVEHIIPIAMGGADDESNMAPAHNSCHAPKTVADLRNVARAKRRKAKHVGAKQSKWPRSKWKRKVSGETVLRATNPPSKGGT
jgi:5-methylcytosine-specific restriction endonuclease McrA